jgi:hypothetical protein
MSGATRSSERLLLFECVLSRSSVTCLTLDRGHVISSEKLGPGPAHWTFPRLARKESQQ